MIRSRVIAAILLLWPASSLLAQAVDAPFTWKAPLRFGTMNSAGMVEYHWDVDKADYDQVWVNPSVFPVAFDACEKLTEPVSWAFRDSINARLVGSAGGCATQFAFEDNHTTYMATVTAGGQAYGPYPIRIRDLLIVNLGDSYSSGEGAPDIARGDKEWATWIDVKCHRSAKAGAAQAAMAIEHIDPHTSVTFLSFACSGATVDTEITDADGKPTGDGRGLLNTYRGVVPTARGPAYVKAQVDMIPTERPVDALIIGAGGNDIQFAKIITDCTSFIFTCRNDAKVVGRLQNDLSALPGKYKRLVDRVNKLNVRHVLVQEYPDPTKNDSRQTCDELMDDVIEVVLEISQEDAKWASQNVLPPLNRIIREAAQAADRPTGPRWHFVDGISALYEGERDGIGHGQCATDNWILTAEESADQQGPDPDMAGAAMVVGAITLAGVTGGAATAAALAATKLYVATTMAKSTGIMHPNEKGYAAARDRLTEELARHLFDANVQCNEAPGLMPWLSGGIKCKPVSNPNATDCNVFQNEFERAACNAKPPGLLAALDNTKTGAPEPKCVKEPGEPDMTYWGTQPTGELKADSGSISIRWLRCWDETSNTQGGVDEGTLFRQTKERDHYSADITVRRARNPARLAARGSLDDITIATRTVECERGRSTSVVRSVGEMTYSGALAADANVTIQKTDNGYQLAFSVENIPVKARDRDSEVITGTCDPVSPVNNNNTHDEYRGGVEFVIPLGPNGAFPARGSWQGPAIGGGRVGMMSVTWNLHVKGNGN